MSDEAVLNEHQAVINELKALRAYRAVVRDGWGYFLDAEIAYRRALDGEPTAPVVVDLPKPTGRELMEREIGRQIKD